MKNLQIIRFDDSLSIRLKLHQSVLSRVFGLTAATMVHEKVLSRKKLVKNLGDFLLGLVAAALLLTGGLAAMLASRTAFFCGYFVDVSGVRPLASRA